jgi:hypothetical protein
MLDRDFHLAPIPMFGTGCETKIIQPLLLGQESLLQLQLLELQLEQSPLLEPLQPSLQELLEQELQPWQE